jgi:hypothetical protein
LHIQFDQPDVNLGIYQVRCNGVSVNVSPESVNGYAWIFCGKRNAEFVFCDASPHEADQHDIEFDPTGHLTSSI